MKGLALYLKRDIECEDGQLFKPENIDEYDNNFDIAAGIDISDKLYYAKPIKE